MIFRQIRLSQQAKEQLVRLKGRTGIRNWNVLCRWAFCVSLKEQSVPADMDVAADSNVEMTWEVFAGEYREVYAALIVQRCIADGLGSDPETVARQFRLHLHRGIAYLSSTHLIRSCSDLVNLALAEHCRGE